MDGVRNPRRVDARVRGGLEEVGGEVGEGRGASPADRGGATAQGLVQ